MSNIYLSYESVVIFSTLQFCWLAKYLGGNDTAPVPTAMHTIAF